MQIIVHATGDERQKLEQNSAPSLSVHYVSSVQDFIQYPGADAYIDFSFDKSEETLVFLKRLKGLVVINSVVYSLAETDTSFIRINGWPGFMESPLIEASFLQENLKEQAEAVFSHLNKMLEWLPDQPGFITPRVICMIINEAYFALAEGVSTKSDIDTAMKLGTAYPYGPFEWAEKIGLKKIHLLLSRLSKEKEQYMPAPLLVQEALTAKD